MRKSITYKFLIYICIYICEFRFVTELIQVLSILIFTNFKLIIFKNQTSVYLNICFQSKFLHGRNIDSTINFNNNLDIEFIVDLTLSLILTLFLQLSITSINRLSPISHERCYSWNLLHPQTSKILLNHSLIAKTANGLKLNNSLLESIWPCI